MRYNNKQQSHCFVNNHTEDVVNVQTEYQGIRTMFLTLGNHQFNLWTDYQRFYKSSVSDAKWESLNRMLEIDNLGLERAAFHGAFSGTYLTAYKR